MKKLLIYGAGIATGAVLVAVAGVLATRQRDQVDGWLKKNAKRASARAKLRH